MFDKGALIVDQDVFRKKVQASKTQAELVAKNSVFAEAPAVASAAPASNKAALDSVNDRYSKKADLCI